jgi:hypothetical protein
MQTSRNHYSTTFDKQNQADFGYQNMMVLDTGSNLIPRQSYIYRLTCGSQLAKTRIFLYKISALMGNSLEDLSEMIDDFDF